MRTSQFLAIAALACMLISVQSVISSGPCPATDDYKGCAACNWITNTTDGNSTDFYSCTAPSTGYYLNLSNPTTGQ
jgi:hypothetical protein